MNRLFQALALAGAVLSGCGGGGDGPAAGEQTGPGGAPVEKQGGKLRVLWTDDVDNIDQGVLTARFDVAGREG